MVAKDDRIYLNVSCSENMELQFSIFLKGLLFLVLEMGRGPYG